MRKRLVLRYNMLMEPNSGLTVEDAQLSICEGHYDKREYTQAERGAACQRYEQLTGREAHVGQSNGSLIIGAVLAIVLIAALVFGYLVYRRKKLTKNRTTSKTS